VNCLLVHSPVVGPSTWRWAAEALREAGHEATVPDLVAAALSGDPASFAAAAIEADQSREPVVLVGHSGAGAVLPLIAAGLASWPRLTVFVDAGIPPCEGGFTAGGDFTPALLEMSTNGILPKWSRWWEKGVLEAIVPDEERRRKVETELPEVPLRFFETPIEVPARWCENPAAYVLLSAGYRREADRASALGWQVNERRGEHLDIVNDGGAIAHILLGFVEARGDCS
jgi:Alpha/beta hydrolase family